MDEDLKLYIPLGVKPEAELFTGFGKKQLFQSIVGSLVMGGIAALAWLFTGNVTTTVILALAGIFGSVMMTTKDQSNLSVVDQVQNLIRFLRGQKIYPYRYGDEWGLESVSYTHLDVYKRQGLLCLCGILRRDSLGAAHDFHAISE